MALPDISGLTEAELQELQEQAGDLLFQKQHSEETTRAALLEPGKVQQQIANLLAASAELSTVIATPNADVNAKPAPYIMAVARATRRVANNTVRLMRVVGQQLDSADVGTET